jgi:hypothetical protein
MPPSRPARNHQRHLGGAAAQVDAGQLLGIAPQAGVRTPAQPGANPDTGR